VHEALTLGLSKAAKYLPDGTGAGVAAWSEGSASGPLGNNTVSGVQEMLTDVMSTMARKDMSAIY
jgi:hypothetical protein